MLTVSPLHSALRHRFRGDHTLKAKLGGRAISPLSSHTIVSSMFWCGECCSKETMGSPKGSCLPCSRQQTVDVGCERSQAGSLCVLPSPDWTVGLLTSFPHCVSSCIYTLGTVPSLPSFHDSSPRMSPGPPYFSFRKKTDGTKPLEEQESTMKGTSSITVLCSECQSPLTLSIKRSC